MASPPKRLERTGDSTPFSRPDNRNGRVNEGLGRGVPRGKNRGAVVSDGAEASHKLLGASSGLICREEFHQGSIYRPLPQTSTTAPT